MKKRKHRGGCLTFIIILALIAGFMYHWNFVIKTETYELRFSDLPQAFDGYRIAVVSDLHAANFGGDNKKLLDAIRKGSPDMIALTGDITDSPGQIDGVLRTVRELVRIAPVYYVTGNHEWEKGEVQELFAKLPETGATVLRNEILPLEKDGGTVYIVGLEDPNGPADMPSPERVFAKLPEGAEFVLTLVHRNTFLEEIANLNADLILCGHGHGGMIRIPFTDGLFGHNFELFPTFTNGEYTIGETTIVVSRGIGNNTGIPRVNNNPHVPVVVLNREN